MDKNFAKKLLKTMNTHRAGERSMVHALKLECVEALGLAPAEMHTYGTQAPAPSNPEVEHEVEALEVVTYDNGEEE